MVAGPPAATEPLGRVNRAAVMKWDGFQAQAPSLANQEGPGQRKSYIGAGAYLAGPVVGFVMPWEPATPHHP